MAGKCKTWLKEGEGGEKEVQEAKKYYVAYSSAKDLLHMLQTGEISSSELLEIYIERIERYDKNYNAVVVRDFENARVAARKADKFFADNGGKNLKPLHGLPMTVKEEMIVGGMSASCRGDLNYHKQEVDINSIDVIESIQQAGAIIFGKTNVPKGCLDWQCYNKVYGNTLNPFDTEVSPGGSSGGSAVALMCGFTPLELGGDSAGSIRIPAAFNGCYGLAPTHGLVPTNRPDFKAVVFGPLARFAQDCELLFNVITGGDEVTQEGVINNQSAGDTSTQNTVDLASLKCLQWRGNTANVVINGQSHIPSSDVQNCVTDLGNLLKQVGVNVLDVKDDKHNSLPLPDKSIEKSLSLFHQLLTMKDKDVENNTDNAVHFFEEQKVLMSEWEAFFNKDFDFIIMPVTISNAFLNDYNHDMNAYSPDRMVEDKDNYEEEASLHGENGPRRNIRRYDSHFFWCHFSIVAQLTSVSIPMGLNEVTKLPQAVQVVCKSKDDKMLLAIATQIEKVLYDRKIGNGNENGSNVCCIPRQLQEDRKLTPVSDIKDFRGIWRRTKLYEPRGCLGPEDEQSKTVLWFQTSQGVFIDMRIMTNYADNDTPPPTTTAVDEHNYNPFELKSFAGIASYDSSSKHLTWNREMDYRPAGTPDVGLIHFTSQDEIEEDGVLPGDDYKELWSRTTACSPSNSLTEFVAKATLETVRNHHTGEKGGGGAVTTTQFGYFIVLGTQFAFTLSKACLVKSEENQESSESAESNNELRRKLWPMKELDLEEYFNGNIPLNEELETCLKQYITVTGSTSDWRVELSLDSSLIGQSILRTPMKEQSPKFKDLFSNMTWEILDGKAPSELDLLIAKH